MIDLGYNLIIIFFRKKKKLLRKLNKMSKQAYLKQLEQVHHGDSKSKNKTNPSSLIITADNKNPFIIKLKQQAEKRAKQKQQAEKRAKQKQQAAKQKQQAAKRMIQQQQQAKRKEHQTKIQQQAAKRAKIQQQAEKQAKQKQQAAKRAKQKQQAEKQAKQKQQAEKRAKQRQQQQQKQLLQAITKKLQDRERGINDMNPDELKDFLQELNDLLSISSSQQPLNKNYQPIIGILQRMETIADNLLAKKMQQQQKAKRKEQQAKIQQQRQINLIFPQTKTQFQNSNPMLS